MRNLFRSFHNLPIRSKLILSFLAVILVSGVIILFIGTRLEDRTIMSLAETKVSHDLASARMLYNEKLSSIRDIVHLSAGREFLQDFFKTGGRPDIGEDIGRASSRVQPGYSDPRRPAGPRHSPGPLAGGRGRRPVRRSLCPARPEKNRPRERRLFRGRNCSRKGPTSPSKRILSSSRRPWPRSVRKP